MADKVLCKVVRLQLSKLFDGKTERFPYHDLFYIQHRASHAKNRTIQVCWEWENMKVAYRYEHGVNPDIKEFSEGLTSVSGYANRILKHEFPEMYSANLSVLIQNAQKAFKNAQLEMQRGERSVLSYKANGPIDIHNKQVQLYQVGNKFYVSLGIFSRPYIKEKGYESTHIDFELYRLGGSQQEIVRRCLTGEYQIGISKLIYNEKKRCWFLNLTYKFTPIKQQGLDPEKIMGVDLGIACVAYMGFTFQKERYIIEGGEVDHFRQKTEARKRSLQRQGKYCGEGRKGHGYDTRTEPVQKIRDAIARFRNTANDKYSHFIIQKAVENGCGTIQMEDLHGLSEGKFLKDWTYYDLRQKVEYKAAEKGITVLFVNPRYTSQRCSQCGYIDRENRPKAEKGQAYFHCLQCGCEMNADYNASLNLATKGIEQIITETLGAKEK